MDCEDKNCVVLTLGELWVSFDKHGGAESHTPWPSSDPYLFSICSQPRGSALARVVHRNAETLQDQTLEKLRQKC